MNKKTTVLIILIFIAIILIGIIIKVNKSSKENNSQKNEVEVENIGYIDMRNTENAKIEEKKKINTSESLTQDKEVENLKSLKLTNIKLLADNGESMFSATITNNSTTKFKQKFALIKFLKENGEEYIELDVCIPDLEAGESQEISSYTTADIINAYNFTIKLK